MKILKKKIKAAAAVENIITLPIVIGLFTVLFYLLMFSLANIHFNNFANIVANDLDLSNNGLIANNKVNNFNILYDSYGHPGFFGKFEKDGGKTSGFTVSIRGVTDPGNIVKNNVLTILKNNEDKMKVIPFSDVQEVRVDLSNYAGNLGVYKGQPGTRINVNIKYRILGFTFIGTGYNIVI